MPHSTRLSTPITRSYITDMWLNNVDDALAREFFFRAKLAADNCGRLPGSPEMLAGVLFPSIPLTRKRVEKVLADLVKASLIFHYKVGNQWFLEICDTGLTQTLVGNMTDISEYPAPPELMITKWERITGRKHKRIGKVRTKSERSSDEVSTGSDGVHTSSYDVKAVRVGKGLVGSGVGLSLDGVGSDFAKSANAIVPSTATAEEKSPAGMTQSKTYGEFIGDPTSGESLEILTHGKFVDDLGFKSYRHREEFLAVVRSCFDARRDTPFGGKPEAADFMGHVVNVCVGQGFKAPKGWMRVLGELRAEAKI
jgi:hypothetical protein